MPRRAPKALDERYPISHPMPPRVASGIAIGSSHAAPRVHRVHRVPCARSHLLIQGWVNPALTLDRGGIPVPRREIPEIVHESTVSWSGREGSEWASYPLAHAGVRSRVGATGPVMRAGAVMLLIHAVAPGPGPPLPRHPGTTPATRRRRWFRLHFFSRPGSVQGYSHKGSRHVRAKMHVGQGMCGEARTGERSGSGRARRWGRGASGGCAWVRRIGGVGSPSVEHAIQWVPSSASQGRHRMPYQCGTVCRTGRATGRC